MSILCHKRRVDVKRVASGEWRVASGEWRMATRTPQLAILILLTFFLGGCGFFTGEEASATAVAPAETRVLMPTFTPTVEAAAQAPAQESQPAQVAVPTVSAPAPTDTAAPQVAETATPLPTDTAVPTMANKPRLTISQPSANVRNGPGKTYGIVGAVTQGQQFDVIGKNPAGDWWKMCCVNGEAGWVFGPLVTVENGNLVAVDQNIAPPPVAVVQPTQPPQPVAQAPAQPAPAQPVATLPPAPPPTAPPAPPIQAGPPDPCASIGGDGCKFKLKGAPTFGAAGGEIKLQLFFIHSGVDGGQPQGSYFVAMFKDGQKLPISDGRRSLALEKMQGGLGPYNYEYSIPAEQVPGGSVGGSYTIYVIDGNGEQDSKNFVINIPDGQGLVYIVFDQG